MYISDILQDLYIISRVLGVLSERTQNRKQEGKFQFEKCFQTGPSLRERKRCKILYSNFEMFIKGIDSDFPQIRYTQRYFFSEGSLKATQAVAFKRQNPKLKKLKMFSFFFAFSSSSILVFFAFSFFGSTI
jgi:hypothetical protein